MDAAFLRDFGIPGDCGAHAVEAVRDDPHADAGAADQNRAVGFTAGDRLRGRSAEVRVIIALIQLERPAVDHFAAFGFEESGKFGLLGEAAVVGRNRNLQGFAVPVGDFKHVDDSLKNCNGMFYFEFITNDARFSRAGRIDSNTRR